MNLPIPQLQSASNSACVFDSLAVGGRDQCALIEN